MSTEATFEAGGYRARPLGLRWHDADTMAMARWKAEVVVRRCAAHEAFFSDYMRGCDGTCPGLCDGRGGAQCEAVKAAVVHTLGKSDAWLWEVWSVDAAGAEVDFAGILRLSDVVPGCTAKAHYFFFDGRLRDKTQLLREWKAWAFGTAGFHRITAEVPTYAAALASHANKLGFGGPLRVGRVACEGVQREAIKWRGVWHDVYILGAIGG